MKTHASILLGFLVLTTFTVDKSVDAKNFFTPLNRAYEFACVAENLKESSTYYCDSYGKIRCLPGWSEEYNLCQTPLCEVNNKTCVYGNCSKPFTCDCEVGWWGQFCEKCVPLPGCVNGYCNRSLECICKDGWEGMHCNKPSCPDCKHGECIMPGVCACHPGWSGPNCTICEPRLDCKYGRCIDEPFQCKCFSKYDGVSCDKPVCKKGCHAKHGFCHHPETCYCRPGWTGEYCDQCVPYWDCKHGKCVDNPWECICEEGWYGPDCNSKGNKDGHWGKWGEWTECSVTCGEGTQKRTRKCNYPAPSGNGTYCSHDGSSCDDMKECIIGICEKPTTPITPPITPPAATPPSATPPAATPPSATPPAAYYRSPKHPSAWTPWTEWSECSVSCGGGFKDRGRICLSDDPEMCNGDIEEESECNNNPCANIGY